MAGEYDVIVIGAGHNGLVTAAYLGRAGLRVLVLERSRSIGGAATTAELAPGIRAPTVATTCGLLRPEVIRDLELGRRGLEFLPLDPQVTSLGEGGKVLRLWRDPQRNQTELRAVSAADADAFPRFMSLLGHIVATLDPLLMRRPIDIASPALGDQLFVLRRALKLRRVGKDVLQGALRLAPMALHDLLSEWFEDELLRSTLAMNGLLGVFRGPWSPGTAFGLVRALGNAAWGGSWSFVRGGMGALSQAIAAAAQDAGVAIRTEADVTEIVTTDGRATGVRLATGETIPSKVVASGADPKRTFLGLTDPKELSPEFVRGVRAIQMEGCVAKVNLAVDRSPQMPELNDEGRAEPHVRIAPTETFIERAYDDAKYGALSREPVLDLTIPTLVDPSLAPTGTHVVSVNVQYTPYRLRTGNWDDLRDDLKNHVVEILEAHMPGLRRTLIASEVLTPIDLEKRFGLTGGHPHHGEMTLNQLFVLRPVPGWSRYRTPIDGLYLCGSGAHPGGGVTGAPGHNAAQQILSDWPRFKSRG